MAMDGNDFYFRGNSYMERIPCLKRIFIRNDIFIEIESEHLKRKLDSCEATITNVPAKLVEQIEEDPKIRAVQFNDKLAPHLCC